MGLVHILDPESECTLCGIERVDQLAECDDTAVALDAPLQVLQRVTCVLCNQALSERDTEPCSSL